MITVLKVNLLTDDESLPADLKDRLEAALRDIMVDDPEGVEHAHVQLEWKATVQNRAYMKGLVGRPTSEHIAPPKPSKVPAGPRRASRRRAVATA